MTPRTKVLSGIAMVVLLVIVGALWWIYHSLDWLVASAIRTFGPEITGVSVRLAGADVAPVDGRAALRGLVVGNPEGFQSEHALSLGEISMTLDIGSLTRDVIVIKNISIKSPEVIYELSGSGSNLDAIQRNVDRYMQAHGGGKAQGQGEDESAGKKLVIENLVITDATARVSATIVRDKDLTVPLPDLQLRDIGKQSNGATAGQVVKQVLGALSRSAASAVAEANLGRAAETITKGAGPAVEKLKGLFK